MLERVKTFDGETISILVKSIKKVSQLYVPNEGFYNADGDIKYPYFEARQAGLQFQIANKYYALYVKNGKMGKITFSRKIFDYICEYVSVAKDIIVDVDININKVNVGNGQLFDSYDDCVVSKNIGFNQSDYPDALTHFAELNRMLDSFPNWNRSKDIKDEMDKHDSLRDYVSKILRKNRNEKIDEILNER